MSQNIEKILYMGMGLLLCALALTASFSYYDNYQSYIYQGEQHMTEDKMVVFLETETSNHITGSEVLYQVLESKKQKEMNEFSDIYGSSLDLEKMSPAEVWVEGEKATNIDLSTIDLERSYSVDYEENPFGKIIVIRYMRY